MNLIFGVDKKQGGTLTLNGEELIGFDLGYLRKYSSRTLRTIEYNKGYGRFKVILIHAWRLVESIIALSV